MMYLLKEKTSKGFTLVELLVVIAILMILATIAFVTYNGVQKKARDAQRVSELYALQSALEVNKVTLGYIGFKTSNFAQGSIPATDPLGNAYCVDVTGSVNPSPWTGLVCPSPFTQVSATSPAQDSTQYKICISTENSGVICRQSTQ